MVMSQMVLLGHKQLLEPQGKNCFFKQRNLSFSVLLNAASLGKLQHNVAMQR